MKTISFIILVTGLYFNNSLIAKQPFPLIKSNDTVYLIEKQSYFGTRLSNISNTIIKGNASLVSGFKNYFEGNPLLNRPEVVVKDNKMLSYSEGPNGEYYVYRPSNQRWYIYREANSDQTGNGIFLNDYTNTPEGTYAIYKNTIYSKDYDGVKFSSTGSGITLNNCKNVTIENLTIEGWNERAISIGYGCENITIRNCTIRFIGWDGIYSDLTSTLTIENCYFEDIHGNGIHTRDAKSSSYRNNRFYRIGIWPARGEYTGNINYQPPCAIRHDKGSNCIIASNIIDSIGYNGIAFYSCDYTQVSHNKISYTNLLIDDGGAIYTWAREKSGNLNNNWIIDSNTITNCIGTYWGIDNPNEMVYDASAIYIDDGNDKGKIRANIIDKATRAVFIHNSRNVEIAGNKFINCSQGALFRNNHSKINITGCSFTNNKMDAQKFILRLWSQSKDNKIWINNTFNNNEYSQNIIILDWSSDVQRLTLEQWQTYWNQDLQSKCLNK